MLDRDQVGPKFRHVARIGFGQNEGPSSPKEVYYDGLSDNAIIATDHLSGTLRLTRAASVFVGYYLEEDEWIALAAKVDTTDNLYFGFSIWSHDYGFADQTVVVTFDNMVISQGDVVCPN